MRFALVAVVCLGLSCSSSNPTLPRLALDERLPAGRARAGVIATPAELLTGVTAKGRVGDFKLYNDRVAVVVSQIGFGGYQPFGGILLDADRLPAPNEPGHSSFGEVIAAFDLRILKPNTIEVVADGRDGGAAIVRIVGQSAPMPLLDALLGNLITPPPAALEMTVDYVLEPDRDWVEIIYKLKNPLPGPLDVGLPLAGFMFGDGAQPFVAGAGFAGPEPGSQGAYYGADSPDVTYLYGRKGSDLQFIASASGLLLASAGEGLTLRGKEATEIRHLLVIGDGDLSAAQQMWQQATGNTALVPLRGRVVDTRGEPVAGVRVHVTRAAELSDVDYQTQARTDAAGDWRAFVPSGESYEVTAVSDALVRSIARTADPSAEPVTLTLDRPGSIAYTVNDEAGAPLPAKLTFVRSQGNEAFPSRFGEGEQPSGVTRAEYGYRGSGTVQLPAGEYRVSISRGSEYEVVERDLSVVADQTLTVTASLARSVRTPGFLSTDTHVHSQLSPDSPDLFPFKVATMVVEGLEIPVSTEHEWIGDFNPSIREMGLEPWIYGLVGSEITTSVFGHFNAFPLIADPTKPGNGRIDWVGKEPAQMFAAIRANPGDPFIQLNHPRSAAIGGYFSAMGYDAATAQATTPRFSTDFDGIEVANGCSVEEIESQLMPDWFSFLNRGMKKVAMGSTDSHRAGKGQMGYPKTFLMMPTNRPSEAKLDDVRRASKEGRAVISCGPFLDLAMGNARVGDVAMMTGDRVEVTATVRAPSWISVTSVELLVNGRVAKIAPIAAVDGPLDVEVTMTASVTAGRDAWVIARARGPGGSKIWAKPVRPYAFTNAIYVDGDRDGAWTMVR